MNHDKLKNLKSFFIFSLFFILFAILILFTFYDLEAAKAFYRGENIFTTIFSYIGKMPAFMILAFSCAVLARCVNVDYSAKSSALKWFFRCVLAFSCMLGFHSVFENFINHFLSLTALTISCAIILTVFIVFITEKTATQRFLKYEKWCLFCFFVILLTLFSVTALKVIVGRPRFNEILNDFSQYSEWYKLDIFGDGNSFPSGHVGLSCTILTVIPLFKTLNIKNLYKYIFIGLSVLFIGAVLISRIVGGYHFGTDVFTSVTIFLFFYFITDHIFYKDKKYYFDNSTKFEKLFNLGIGKSNILENKTDKVENAQ